MNNNLVYLLGTFVSFSVLVAILVLGIRSRDRLAFDNPAYQTTTASWYGEKYRGKTMANGMRFVPEALTCASRDYDLGTRLLVVSELGRVVVVVTDRGPSRKLVRAGRRLDLSIGSWRALGLDPDLGIARVSITRLP